MRWRWRFRRPRRACSGDARPDAQELLERVKAQEPQVDDVVARTEYRYRRNHFREAVQTVWEGGDMQGGTSP
jgi:hypothetical protein